MEYDLVSCSELGVVERERFVGCSISKGSSSLSRNELLKRRDNPAYPIWRGFRKSLERHYTGREGDGVTIAQVFEGIVRGVGYNFVEELRKLGETETGLRYLRELIPEEIMCGIFGQAGKVRFNRRR